MNTEATTPLASNDACTGESPSNSAPWYHYFTTPQWVVYAATITLGLIFRWTLLDMRPYHHDESLHGMYGRYFYDWPNANFYKYDPMLHGPMLYNCMRFIYAMFGDSLWAARTPAAIMGSLCMLTPFLFRSFFHNRSTTLFLTAAVALSPTLVYWSRFLREDSWVLLGLLVALYGLTLAPARAKALFFLLGMTIQWCTKENTVVTIAITVGYLMTDMVARILNEDVEKSLVWRAVKYCVRHPLETSWAVILAVAIYAWFFTAGFRYPEGLKAGLGWKGFEYWLDQDKKQRIEGPFNFHIYVLGWYELPFMLAFITHLVLFYVRSSPVVLGGATLVALTTLSWVLGGTAPTAEGTAGPFGETWRFLKLKDKYDFVGCVILLLHAPCVTFLHMLKGEWKLAITGYFFTATFFVYSYLGEKVPWLSLYPLVFGLPYLCLFFENYFRQYPIEYKRFPLQKVLLSVGGALIVLGVVFILESDKESTNRALTWFIEIWGRSSTDPSAQLDPSMKENLLFIATGVLLVLCVISNIGDPFLGRINIGIAVSVLIFAYNIRATIQTNFLYAGKETEYLSQVHTTYDLAATAKHIIDVTQNEKENFRPKILVEGEATWPMTWYFRHLREEYKFSAKPEEYKDFTYLFLDWKDKPEDRKYPEGFYIRKMNLRGWWVPDFKQMTLKKFLTYSVNHYPWGPSGFSYTTLLVNRDFARLQDAERPPQ